VGWGGMLRRLESGRARAGRRGMIFRCSIARECWMNCLTKSPTTKREGGRQPLVGGDGAWVQALKNAKVGFNFLRRGFRRFDGRAN